MKKEKIKKFSNKKNLIIVSVVAGVLILIGGYGTYRHVQNNKVLSEAKASHLASDNTFVKKEVNENSGQIDKKEEVKKEKAKNNVDSKNTEIKKEDNKKADSNTDNSDKTEAKKAIVTKENNEKKVVKKENEEQQTGLAGKISKTQIAKQTNQIILVAGNELSLWNKSNGKWNENLSSSARLGYGGLTDNKHEGDGATPVGIYPILYGFGFGSNPGTSLEYKKINNNSYFVDDVHSKYYNQWYEGKGQKGEHMIDHQQYKYGMIIGYNTSQTKEKGSAIFLHCNGNGNTAGCVSIPQSEMLKLLKCTHEGAYIVITSSENNLRYY